jgi:hypothetical protein
MAKLIEFYVSANFQPPKQPWTPKELRGRIIDFQASTRAKVGLAVAATIFRERSAVQPTIGFPVASLAVSLGTRQLPVDPVERSLEALLSLAERAREATMTLQDVPINPTGSGRPSTMHSGRTHVYYGD